MAEIQFPVIYCATYNTCENIKVEFPFGLPMLQLPNPCCGDPVQLMIDLNGILAPLTPLIRVVGCIVKLTDIVMGIPDAIGPPPSITKVIEVVEKIGEFTTECIPFLISLAPLPINIIAYVRFVKDILKLVVIVLGCIKKILTVSLSVTLDLMALDGYTVEGGGGMGPDFALGFDLKLQAMAACLGQQVEDLGQSIVNKLGPLATLFDMINAILGVILTAIPPLKSFMEGQGYFPLQLGFDAGVPPVDFTAIDGLINVLNVVINVSISIGGT